MSSVLLVDDEPGVLFTLSELLLERGHKVATAGSGAEALAKLDDAEAVLTDLSMPKMNGLRGRSAPRHHPTRVPLAVLAVPVAPDSPSTQRYGLAFPAIAARFPVSTVPDTGRCSTAVRYGVPTTPA